MIRYQDTSKQVTIMARQTVLGDLIEPVYLTKILVHTIMFLAPGSSFALTLILAVYNFDKI